MEKREGGPGRVVGPEEEYRERMSSFYEVLGRPELDVKKKKRRSCLLSPDTVYTLNRLYSRFQKQTLVFVQLIGRPL